jgi:hypothetical protein
VCPGCKDSRTLNMSSKYRALAASVYAVYPQHSERVPLDAVPFFRRTSLPLRNSLHSAKIITNPETRTPLLVSKLVRSKDTGRKAQIWTRFYGVTIWQVKKARGLQSSRKGQ